jgi:hypothetical protein
MDLPQPVLRLLALMPLISSCRPGSCGLLPQFLHRQLPTRPHLRSKIGATSAQSGCCRHLSIMLMYCFVLGQMMTMLASCAPLCGLITYAPSLVKSDHIHEPYTPLVQLLMCSDRLQALCTHGDMCRLVSRCVPRPERRMAGHEFCHLPVASVSSMQGDLGCTEHPQGVQRHAGTTLPSDLKPKPRQPLARTL